MSAPAEIVAPPRIDADLAHKLLEKRYPSPEWALMQEVAPATGGGTGYADAVAVNLWTSRGHAVHGFEIKVSRSDWLRELKDPAKAEPVFRYCDCWWIVAPPGIVKEGELPKTWGLLEIRANGLVAKIGAPALEAKPVTRAFFASLMRRGHEQIHDLARRAVATELTEGRERMEERIAERVKDRTRDHDRLAKSVAQFELSTGLKIDPWGGLPIETIKLAQALEEMRGFRGGMYGRLRDLADQVQRASETLRKALDEHAPKETT